ncbi:Uncharacterised protein [Acinetobacter baumannii]|nr:Uncharacterised protein [Acinetobacter baumannii]
MVYGAHFQADDAAAHNQQTLWDGFQRQRIGRIPHAWIFMRNEWQLDRTRTCSDDGVVEVDGGWAVFAFNNQGVSAGELAQAVDHFHFTAFRHASQTAGQLSDDFFFPDAHFVDVGFRLAENDAVFGQRFGFFDHFGNVQQCFGRDTSHVQANPAQSGITFNQNGFKT